MVSDPTVLADLLAAALDRDPTGPLLTYYDEGTGERTELSATTLDNWVAKTANLLVDGSGLDADGTAAVLLPAHWQTAAVLLGCFAAGLPVVGPAGGGPVDVAFSTPDSLDTARALRPGETYLLGLAPLAMPLREVPPGAADYVLEVRAFGDRFVPAVPVDPDAPALDGCSHRELLEQAAELVAGWGLEPGDRLLLPVGDGGPAARTWLLAPLLAGASVVLCRGAGAERVAAIAGAERVTRTLQPESRG